MVPVISWQPVISNQPSAVRGSGPLAGELAIGCGIIRETGERDVIKGAAHSWTIKTSGAAGQVITPHRTAKETIHRTSTGHPRDTNGGAVARAQPGYSTDTWARRRDAEFPCACLMRLARDYLREGRGGGGDGRGVEPNTVAHCSNTNDGGSLETIQVDEAAISST